MSGYDLVYKWFSHLQSQGHYVVGYVITPNHLDVVIGFVKTDQRINMIIGNGKRFIAYEIIKRLEEAEDFETLKILEESVESKRRENAKRHNVWQLSFDWKYCESE